MSSTRFLELLSPAQNSDTAIQALLHGADAVYMGASSHGARKNAANTIEEIEKVVDFAHQYRAKVYITVNTLIYEEEIRKVESLCRDLYYVGVDALIIQDMGILRMKIPPIALHASTQCDIRTPEKAKFLEEVGFSQLVLARELTLKEIKEITSTVTIPVECFVHGALCVCYSGRCHASQALTGRSGNRGECAQICRWPFTLIDSNDNVIIKDKYLLSLKDFNASESIEDLIDAGVSSFKIEGRLKDSGYVKNITSYYSKELNKIISNKKNYKRSSFGEVKYSFNPNPEKSFNRGFTDYFLKSRTPLSLSSFYTPKSRGEKIEDMRSLHNGDGISFCNDQGEYTGVNINKVEAGKIITSRPIKLPKNGEIFRTYDLQWEKMIAGKTADRKIPLDIKLDNSGLSIKDSRDLFVKKLIDFQAEKSSKTQDYSNIFGKLGNTVYRLKNFQSELKDDIFYRFSDMTNLRREIIAELESCNKATYPYSYRRTENPHVNYPEKKLDFRDNVANSLARKFYNDHGVTEIEPAAETRERTDKTGEILMTTRHCILRELSLCKKRPKLNEGGPIKKFVLNDRINGDLFLLNGSRKLRLTFDCDKCEMNVHKE